MPELAYKSLSIKPVLDGLDNSLTDQWQLSFVHPKGCLVEFHKNFEQAVHAALVYTKEREGA